MKSVYITEEQKNNIRKFVISEDKWRALLSEENSSIKKKVKKIIRQFCSPYVSNYLDTPLVDLPDWLSYQLNPGGNETAMFRAVKNNPTENRFIDFLKVNLYDQMGTKYDKGPWEYLPGAARILCEDLGFYSFSPDVMRGGDIIKFAKTIKLIHNHPDFFLDGEQLDSNLNGMNYEQFMDKFAERLRAYRQNIESECGNIAAPNFGEYRIVRVRDSVNPNGQVLPTDTGRQLLNDLDGYTDWCICGTMQNFEYPQYTAGGGAVYIMMKPNFRSIEKAPGQNCPLDNYGLSLICVIVGPDGLPDNITTRWNHEYGGENPEGMSTASELQRITGVDYFRTFKPRSERDLVAMHMNESKDKPSAMDQVHNKVNAGIMDAVTAGGMMEEGSDNSLETWYRGYNSKFGPERTNLFWVASDVNYAKQYGDDVEEVVIDMNKIREPEGIFDDNFDTYFPSDKDIEEMKSDGYNAYTFPLEDDEYDCDGLCLFDKSPIVSRRILSHDELQSLSEGAEPESDEYTIGGEGGNNEYFHVMNESKIGNFDFKKYFKPIAEFMKNDGLNVYPYPNVKLNWEPQGGLFIKTGYYEPESKTIVIFCDDRHPKDILRTFCHEMIHHSQNLDGVDLNFTSNDDVKDNERLEEIESEAYLKGNVYFRKWTEYQHKNNDLLQESSIKESPDFADGNRYYDPKAIPFGALKGSDEIMVGNQSETHLKMLRDYLDSNSPGVWQERFDGKTGEKIFDEVFDTVKTGRYWPNDNLISFWEYNKGLRGANQIIRNAVKSIEDSYGMSIDLDTLDVDIWTYNGHECDCIVPFYWISHNFADVFIESAKYIEPIGDGTYEVTMNNHERRRFDVKGYEIQPKYAMYESIDIKKALSDLRKRCDPDGIEKLDEDTNPEDIDLSSFNIKTALNPKFWKDEHLDSRIRMKLLDIADDFIEFLGVDWVKPDDIIMTGSLANYNWNKKFSDIDLHILMDYSKVDKRRDFVDNYFYSQKKLWNDEHKDLKIFGFPVEVYVQDTNEKHSSTGVYSLDKDKWLVEPEREKLSTAKINKSMIKNKVADYIDKIEKLLTIYKTADDDYKVRKVSEKADKLFDEIKADRKKGLDKTDNEISNGNLIFKCLRRLGYIEKLVNLKSETYDKMNSLS